MSIQGNYERVRVFCDYQLGPHLAPYCHDYCPNCDGYPDGLYINEHWGDPYYKKCLDGRTIGYGRCTYNDTWETYTFINKGQCVSVFVIPDNEHQYGKLPSCIEKSDGSYQYLQEKHKYDAYFTYKNGTAKGIKCPGTQLFDVNTGTCREGANCIK